MYKMIGGDQKQYGPVTSEELRKWVVEGRADGKTLIQKEGENDWKPISSFPELMGGVPPPMAESRSVQDAAAFSAEILSREFDVDIGACVSRGWDLVKTHFGLAVGATFLVLLATGLASAIPFLGNILGIVLNGVFYGGLYWFFLRLIRGEEPKIEDAFAGFKRHTAQLILAGIVVGVLMVVVMFVAIPFLLPLLGQIIWGGGKVHGFNWQIGVSVFVMVIVCILASILWMFTFPLVIDRGLGFWDAMELSRKVAMRVWPKLFLLFLVSGALACLGILACCVGVLVTAPIAIAAMTYAYEDIFGASKPETA